MADSTRGALSRSAEAKTLAVEIALSLVASGLRSSDPALAPLCGRLSRYRDLLQPEADPDDVRAAIEGGLTTVPPRPTTGDRRRDAVQILHDLADKLDETFGTA